MNEILQIIENDIFKYVSASILIPYFFKLIKYSQYSPLDQIIKDKEYKVYQKIWKFIMVFFISVLLIFLIYTFYMTFQNEYKYIKFILVSIYIVILCLDLKFISNHLKQYVLSYKKLYIIRRLYHSKFIVNLQITIYFIIEFFKTVFSIIEIYILLIVIFILYYLFTQSNLSMETIISILIMLNASFTILLSIRINKKMTLYKIVSEDSIVPINHYLLYTINEHKIYSTDMLLNQLDNVIIEKNGKYTTLKKEIYNESITKSKFLRSQKERKRLQKLQNKISKLTKELSKVEQYQTKNNEVNKLLEDRNKLDFEIPEEINILTGDINKDNLNTYKSFMDETKIFIKKTKDFIKRINMYMKETKSKDTYLKSLRSLFYNHIKEIKINNKLLLANLEEQLKL